MDIIRQIEYWRLGASEDWEVAVELISSRRTRHGLFFAHLALEKLLKDLGKSNGSSQVRLLKAELESVADKSFSPRFWAKETSV